ncbi:MAG: hypothetical protein AAGB18_06460, partial [Pseudomonadota bacterium]
MPNAKRRTTELGGQVLERFVFAIRLFILITLMALPAGAQIPLSGGGAEAAESVELPDPLTPDAIDALVSRLSDEDVRGLLLDQLNAEAVSEDQAGSGAGFRELLYHATIGAFLSTIEGIVSLPSALSGQAAAIAAFHEAYGGAGWTNLLISVAVAIGVGLLIEWPFNRLVLRWFPTPGNIPDPTLKQSIVFLARR